jgi:hypothetical protein
MMQLFAALTRVLPTILGINLRFRAFYTDGAAFFRAAAGSTCDIDVKKREKGMEIAFVPGQFLRTLNKLAADNWMDSFYHSDWKKELFNEEGSVTRV